MIVIDGSIGEGGGQVLRTALSVSCVLGTPVRIERIRAGRAEAGLRAQHLAVCRLLALISEAELRGARIGSTEVEFCPRKIRGGEFSFDIGTAGSITLLLQAVLPVLARAERKSRLSVIGGTHVPFAPTFDYFSQVFLPAASAFGLKARAKMTRAGFYPSGGGRVELEVEPSAIKGAAIGRQDAPAFFHIVCSRLPADVAQRQKAEIEKRLPQFCPRGKIAHVDAACAGNAVFIWKGFVGASSLGKKGKPAEKVAQEACDAFVEEEGTGAPVDSHLADQLLVYAAIAEGRSTYKTGRMSLHLQTNAEILRRLTGRNIILAGGEVAVE
ncbi:MAG: RNA 3'-terminal phosphate cyclase [Candidatus Micrarchaeota archaeon]|nr:RNA 3'-terminal phosphate cyclase [Candidatus Micrarchaeota archaeon]